MKRDFELKTERLVIKPLGIKYLETCHEYASDPENTKYMLHLPADDIEGTRAFLQSCDEMWLDDNDPEYECAVLLDGVHIGGISIYLEGDSGELGWIMNKKYWGNGYIPEAAAAFRDYAINSLGVRHLIAHCDAENVGSYRVMEKIGMKFVDKYPGRRNKLTPEGEDRYELLYRLDV